MNDATFTTSGYDFREIGKTLAAQMDDLPNYKPGEDIVISGPSCKTHPDYIQGYGEIIAAYYEVKRS